MYMCMYIYIYIHTYIHTYMYIRPNSREGELDIPPLAVTPPLRGPTRNLREQTGENVLSTNT